MPDVMKADLCLEVNSLSRCLGASCLMSALQATDLLCLLSAAFHGLLVDHVFCPGARYTP